MNNKNETMEYGTFSIKVNSEKKPESIVNHLLALDVIKTEKKGFNVSSDLESSSNLFESSYEYFVNYMYITRINTFYITETFSPFI